MVNADVIILAAGNSSRFGIPKLFLKMRNGLTFVETLVNIYLESGCNNIILILNQNHLDVFMNTFTELFISKIKIICNDKTELGRFYSLKLGAGAVSDCDYCFIQNIDNPFTDKAILEKLYNKRQPDSYINPVYLDKGGHPVLIHRKIIDDIKKETNISLNTKEFLDKFNKINVFTDNDKILANINTPDDYKFYFE